LRLPKARQLSPATLAYDDLRLTEDIARARAQAN